MRESLTVTEKYRAVNEGRMAQQEFVRQMRLAFPSLVSQFNGYDDSVTILKRHNLLFEDFKEPLPNSVSDDSLRRALDIEIAALGHDPVTCSDGEVQAKAKDKALANLKKDPLHYYNLLAKESSKVDKNDKMKETKRGALEKDTFNGMKKATLKEAKLMTEGTRALIGYLAGNRLTTAYNHYDGYPENLGKGLEAHYNDDDKAKDIAMKGYITYLNPDTGEIEQTHKDAPKKLTLPQDEQEFAREIAEEIDGMGADFGYIWDDRSNRWLTIKNTGIRSMVDQILEMFEEYGDLDETEEEYLAKKDAAIKKAMGKEELGEVDSTLDPYEDRKAILKQVIMLLKTEKAADTDIIKDFIRTHMDDILNAPDDQAILDEFDDFVSVNYESPSDFMNEETDYSVELLVPLVAFDVESGELADSPYAFATEDEIESGEADVTTYTDGAELDSFVFDNDYEQAVYFAKRYPKLIKINSGNSVAEKKGKDHDGDGDIDGDDYMAAKDKAIKKATGKGEERPSKFKKAGERSGFDMRGIKEAGKDKMVKEAVKSIIQKVLEEQVLNEAATNELAKIADEYAGFEGLKPSVISLENIVTEIEAFYDKTRDKIQKVYNDLGNITNEEGLKVGAFIAPAIESAFNKDLRPAVKKGFTAGLDTPKVKRVSQADVDRGYVQQEAPKDTVFRPVNEKKK